MKSEGARTESAVQNSQGTATTEIEKNLDFPSGELSPAELAELAEEGEPMLEMGESDFSEDEQATASSNETIENIKEKV